MVFTMLLKSKALCNYFNLRRAVFVPTCVLPFLPLTFIFVPLLFYFFQGRWCLWKCWISSANDRLAGYFVLLVTFAAPVMSITNCPEVSSWSCSGSRGITISSAMLSACVWVRVCVLLLQQDTFNYHGSLLWKMNMVLHSSIHAIETKLID